MSLLPDDIEDMEVEESETLPELIEYGIDFETGELTGKLVSGIEAVKVWIYLALRTPRYRHTIFSWDYGNEIDDLIGKGYSEEYIQTEAERMFEETLTVSDYIESVTNVEVTKDGDKVVIKGQVNTIYGEVEASV